MITHPHHCKALLRAPEDAVSSPEGFRINSISVHNSFMFSEDTVCKVSQIAVQIIPGGFQ